MTERKNKGGRPPKFTADPEGVAEMQAKIDKYFGECKPIHEYGQHPTVTGLALALDMTRETLVNYEVKPQFLSTVKKAKQRVQQHLEQHLYGTAVTGAIFNLKNNFGWKDTQHQERTQTTKVITLDSDDDGL